MARGGVAPALLLLALFVSSAALLRAAEAIEPISSHPFTNVAAAGGSYLPAFSADGRHLVFLSHANNLVANDDLEPHLQRRRRPG